MSDKLRILAVDDSSINLATIEQELKSKYDVITVNSGTRALRFLQNEKPDLILLDIQMALKDGIETLKDIRGLENGASIPVIMLTAKTDRDSIIESSRLGIYDYVVKPFNADDLHERIRRTLIRSGALPVGDDELYANVRDVQRDVRSGNISNAVTRLNAILNYQMDEELFGRMQAVRVKLQSDDVEGARRFLNRVLKILDCRMHPGRPQKAAISLEDTGKRLRGILAALEEFKVRDAAQLLTALLAYDVHAALADTCEEAAELLEEFDDGAAEELIKKALDKLNEMLMFS